MPYVERDGANIVGVYAVPQPGIATEFIEDDHADMLAFEAARAPDYRAKRKAAYADQLGGSPGSVIDTLGDVLDVLITQVEANRVATGASMTSDYEIMLAKIAAIKAANPPGG